MYIMSNCRLSKPRFLFLKKFDDLFGFADFFKKIFF